MINKPTLSAPKLWLNLFYGVLILLPAFLAVFKYAKAGLNADIILNQIMALQHVTLFYWGQNRLINLVPFILQIVTWPALNLFFVLFLASAAFFCLLWLCALVAAKLQTQSRSAKYTALVYLLNVGLCMAFFKHDAWVSLCLWHFEYSFSLILGIINFYAFYSLSKSAALFSLGAGFLAVGLNPSIILLLFPGLCLKCFHTWKITARDIILGSLWLLFFCLWWFIARAYGSFSDYSTILPGMFGIGLENFTINMFREYLLAGRMLFCIFLALCIYAIYCKFGHDNCRNDKFQRQLSVYSLIAGIFAAAIIACIRWYHMNEFGPRYFIFFIFIFIFIFSIWSFYLLSTSNLARWQKPAAVALASITIFFLYPHNFNLLKSDIYRECDNLVPAGGHFYAGDYWKIWACVSRDLNAGYSSFSLGYRSNANKSSIMKTTGSQLDKNDFLIVSCLQAEPAQCVGQIREFWPDLAPVRITKMNPGNFELRMEKP